MAAYAYQEFDEQEIDVYTDDDESFLAEARRLYEYDRNCDKIDRDEAEADNVFANATDTGVEQWNPDVLKMRLDPKAPRPVQQWNRIPTYVQQIGNQTRLNKPAILITPGDKGLPETADFLEEHIRHIEYESNASHAYDTTGDQQVTSGRGFIRVDVEYIPGTFRQRLCILPIENQFTVVFDAASRLYDCSDATRCFIINKISKDEHKRLYGSRSLVNRSDFVYGTDFAPSWMNAGERGDLIQIAEYWVKEFKKRRLCRLPAGVSAWKDEIPKEDYGYLKATGQIIEERDDFDFEIVQYVINGAEILSRTKWLGKTIPIVPVWGRIAVVNGTRRTFSLIRNVKDPQRLVNLYVSNIAEQIAQMPKTPYLVPVGGIAANHEDDWANASNSALAYLYYNAFDAAGKPLPMPSRVTQNPPIEALSVGLQQAIDAMKAGMGIFDASMGARSNETSGVAIDQRRNAAEVVNYHFSDNQAKSRKRVGQIAVEIIPQIYGFGQTLTARSYDGKTRTVQLGVPQVDPKTGNTVTHVLTDADYGVHVSNGPSIESRREEIYQRDAELVKANPELIYAIGPEMYRADPTAGNEERAVALERYINIKYPGLRPPQKTNTPIPLQIQQHMTELEDEVQAKDAFARDLHQKLETKQADLDNQIRLKQMDLEFQREKLAVDNENAKLKIASTEGIEELKHQIAILQSESSQIHELMKQHGDQRHEAAQAEQQRLHAADTQQAQLDHQASESDQAQAHEAEQNSADRDATMEQIEAQPAPTQGAE